MGPWFSIIEGLFPGFIDGLVRAGAPYFDGDLSKVYIDNGGQAMPSEGHIDDFEFVLPSRPLLECHVRQRVYNVDNIEIRDGHDVVELITAEVVSRVPSSAHVTVGATRSWRQIWSSTPWVAVAVPRPSWRAWVTGGPPGRPERAADVFEPAGEAPAGSIERGGRHHRSCAGPPRRRGSIPQ